jgi:hypothetical protein
MSTAQKGPPMASSGSSIVASSATDSGGGASFPISLLGLGPIQDQYDPGSNMVAGTVNPLVDPALGKFTVITVKGADNQATRITGIDSTGVAVDTVVLFLNLSVSGIDCGQVIFNHLDESAPANDQILCPADMDYMLPIFGGVFVYYGSDLKWHPISENGQHQTVALQNLRFYPNALMPQITGQVNNWNPEAESSYSPGEGLAGGDCQAENYTLFRVQVAASGATLTGFEPNAGTNANPSTNGGVKVFVNVGPGPLTLSHLNGASTAGHQFVCPNGVDYVLRVGEAAWICSMLGDPSPSSDWQVLGIGRTMATITTASIPGTLIDNYDPVDATSGVSYLQSDWVFLEGSVDTALNSMNPGIHGARVMLSNPGSGLTINHSFSGGTGGVTTGKAFTCPNNADFVLLSNASVEVAYNANSQTWWVLSSHSGGA